MTRADSMTEGGRRPSNEQAMTVGLLPRAAGGEAPRSLCDATQAGATTRDGASGGSFRRVLQAGEHFDHFVLVRPLGEGGFGQVWLANDVRLGREVAIKLPHRRWRPDSLEARRFQREAAVAAKLTHPNLIPILDAELESEHAYIVSEYCPGPTLTQWLRDRTSPVPPQLAVSIVAQLADGLKVAHDRGLIHRDIKPSNIILTQADSESPVPRLTDFGLARASADTPETHVGTLIGSGPYMSPEQAAGNTDDHGPHSDVHALGVLLYELLTGESPFASVSEIDTIRRIVSQDPPSVRQRRPSLSRDISAVCQHCLEKQPSRRYRDAGELLADLRRVLAGHSPIARPIGHLGRTWRWATRNRGLASMAVAAIASLIVGAVCLFALVIQSRHSAALSEAQRLHAEQQSTTAERMRRRAVTQQKLAQNTREQSRRNSYTSDISLAFLRLHQGHYGEARNLIDRQLPQIDQDELRTIEWYLLDTEVKSRYAVLGNHDGRGTELAVLGHRQNAFPLDTVVSAALDGNLIFWDVATGRERWRLSGLHGRLDAIAALPSGDLLISSPKWPLFGTSVIAIDPESGKTRDAFHTHVSTVESIRASTGASVIASGSRYSSIHCSFPDNARNFSIENGTRNSAFGLSSDGTRLLISRRKPDALQVWDTASRTMIGQWNTATVERVAMAHAHPYAAYELCFEKGFGLVSTDDLEQRRWIETDFTPNSLEFSGDDEYIALADSRSGAELFQRVTEHETESVSSKAPPNYRSISKVAGQGGRIEDIEFIGPQEFVTISISGAVERYAPTQPTHAKQTLIAANPHCISAVEGPAGLLSLSRDGKLNYFPAGPITQAGEHAMAGQQVFEASTSLSAFAVSPDHQVVAVSDSQGHVYLLSNWRDRTGKLMEPDVRTLAKSKSSPANSLGFASFSSTGQFLAVMSNPSELAVYDLSKDTPRPEFRRSYENDQTCVTFSPRDQKLFVCGLSGIEMIDLSSSESTFRLREEDLARIACFSPQGDRLIVGLQDGSIAFLDQQTGQSSFSLHGIDVTGVHSDCLVALCFVSESKLMTLGAEGNAHFWNVDQRVQLGSFPIIPPGGSSTRSECLHVSERGDALTVALDRESATEVHRWAFPDVCRIASHPVTDHTP